MIETGSETVEIDRLDEGAHYSFQVTGTWDGASVALEEWSEAAGGYVTVNTFTANGTFRRFVMGNRARFVGSSVSGSTLLAVAHLRLKDLGSGTSPERVQSALAGDPAGAREAMEAQSRDVGFLNRFGRLANTTAVTTGSTPEIGENVHIHWGSGSANPTVQNEALEAAAGTLIYYGANVPSPGKRFTITVWAELRINSGYVSGTAADDLTFGVNAKPWNAVAGLGGFLNSPQCLHAQVRTTGETGADFYTEAPSVTRDDSADTIRAIGAGIKFPITIDVDGVNNICRITVCGRTMVFRDSRYSRCVDEASTGFFVEWAAPTSAHQYYWAIHSIAVNAPELHDSRSFEGGEYGREAHNLWTRDTATIPSRTRRLGGAVRFNSDQGAVNATDADAIAGNPHAGYAPYCRPAPFVTSRLAGVSERSTAALTSGAGAADANIHNIQSLAQLTTFTGNQLAAGAFLKTVYFIRLAANTNTKRLKIINNAGGPTRFDSGDITGSDGNGAQMVLTHYQFRQSGGMRYNTILEWSVPGSRTPFRVQTYNEAAAVGVGDQLRVTGTSAGDITIDHHYTEMHPVP